MRPGVDVISRALPPPRSAPTDTGVAFMIGATVSGAAVALVHSMTEYEAAFGVRTGGAPAWDAADVYFREGGYRLYVSRTNPGVAEMVGQTSLDAMTRAELDARATELGLDPAEYATKADVIAAIEGAGGAELFAADAGVLAALNALTKDLGPGQVFIADPTLAAVKDNQSALLAHAQACNRVALLSAADGTAAALEAAGTALQTDANARYGALFAPSAIVPGVVAGTTRTVPYAAVEAGILSRNDVAFSPNVPAAGDLGQAVYALNLAARYSDSEYAALNLSSVNMARLLYGGVRTYGFRSCVDGAAVPQWLSFGWSRLNMGITAEAEAVGEHYVFAQLDGRRRTIADFGAELSAMLAGYYEAGSLYGATPPEAYQVDVGAAVNTEATIANGELHAVLKVRMSPFAEWVVIEIVKVATTESLPVAA